MRLRPTAAISTLATAALCAGLLVGTAAPASACPGLSGLGTAGDPWLISSDTDVPLVTMCMPTSGYFRQTADITVSNNSLVPTTFSGTYDGGGHTITFDGAANVQGVFDATSGASISDLTIVASNGATLAAGAGWLSARDSGSSIANVRSTGDISTSGGGIVGVQASGTIITGAHSSGAIGAGGGGIVGGFASGVSVTASSSSGDIDINGGGILGQRPEGGGVYLSYSTGAIGQNAGGIVGTSANWGTTMKTLIISNCFSTGAIGTYAGGIVGYFANGTSTQSAIAITGVFSTGVIGNAGGGILGSEANYGADQGSITITEAYSLGTISALAGGILGSGSNNTARDSSITIANAYASGSIDATGGGIMGAGATGPNSDVIITGVYSSGASPAQNNGIYAPNASVPIVLNSYAEATSGQSGFNDAHFSAVATGVRPWSRGVWGSCQVNTPQFLQAEFDRNPCHATATRSPAVTATFDGGSSTFVLSQSSLNLGYRSRFTLVNAITGLPSQNLVVYADAGLLRFGVTECTQASPCEIYSGSMFGGGQQALFTARRLGTVHVAYRTNPISAPVPVGDLALHARLTLRGTHADGTATFRGHTRPLVASKRLTVMVKLPGAARFTAAATIANTDGNYRWSRQLAPGRSIEVYVTDGVNESNRVTL